MKKFTEAGVYYALSIFRIKAVPLIEEGEERGIRLAKTICGDACYLSTDGSGQASIELLRIDGGSSGSEIKHFLTIRTYDSSETLCVVHQEALTNGVYASLHQAGYEIEEIPYMDYRKSVSKMNKETAWALVKQDVQEYGIHRSYRTPPVVDSVDWKHIYESLAGSGCSIYIQIIPSLLTAEERALVMRCAADCSQAMDGVIPNMRDSLASSAAERWTYYAKRERLPFAQVNVVICGKRAGAALVTARIKQSIDMSSFTEIPVAAFGNISIYNHPWQLASRIRKSNDAVLGKWTVEEASLIFRMPEQSDYFTGIRANIHSLLPENELLHPAIAEPGREKIHIGKAILSGRDVFLPYRQLLYHTAIVGKTGSGKTTFLTQMIKGLSNSGIPVTILEPVKREFRDTVATIENGRIFTVEKPVVPLLINPFRVPKGVKLGDYRSQLFSAFKAAFSLPDPLPSLFEKAISDAYSYYGWSDISRSSDADVTIFDMSDFVRIFKGIISKSNYSTEVKGNMMSGGAFRLQSLIERCPHTFDTINSTEAEDLLQGCTVLEMGNLEPEQKALVSALVLISILAYLKATRTSGSTLRNIILIDEAHALLDQGNGITEEEKALSNTMTQLMNNIITEIRAYGVGVIFSDQSASRVGSCLLDNVDNIISFRLSGQEASLIGNHMGLEETASEALPHFTTGDAILKNHLLRKPLAVRMVYDSKITRLPHLTEDQVAKKGLEYLRANADKYSPYDLCKVSGCKHCSTSVRERSHNLAVRIFAEQRDIMKTPEGIAGVIMAMPSAAHTYTPEGQDVDRLTSCAAIQLLRMCKVEYGISISGTAVSKLLEDMRSNRSSRREGRKYGRI